MKVNTIQNFIESKKNPEILFWVGCAGSFDERYKKVTKAFIKILNKLKVNYAVLGKEEGCTGDPARRAGNEYLFQMQALSNISTLNLYNIKKIVTTCPHCFNTLKNEYPELGGNYDVIHHTEFLNELLKKGKKYLESKLFNGEYFFQKIQTEGLETPFKPLDFSTNGTGYKEIISLLNKEGPKYQYGSGCLSDGVLGFWIAQMCGLGELVDKEKVKSNLKAIYKYNLKHDLSEHSNPQRPSYAVEKVGGLLLCTWPRGG